MALAGLSGVVATLPPTTVASGMSPERMAKCLADTENRYEAENTMTDELSRLYESATEDFRYGIGSLVDLDGARRPIIKIRYPPWPQEFLTFIAGCLSDGLTMRTELVLDKSATLHLASRQKLTVQVELGGGTHILRAPAWGASLEGIDATVHRDFAET